MSDAVLGAVLLHLLGLPFLAAAGRSWLRRRAGVSHPVGVVTNALIGSVAVGDAAVGLVDDPARGVAWSASGLVLLLVVGALLLHHRRAPTLVREPRPAPPPEAIPAPRVGGTYMPLSSTRS